MKKFIIVTCAALLLTGCDRGVVVSEENVLATVTARKNYSRRFWVSFVDQRGNTWKVRLGVRRCHQGPSNFTPGKTIQIGLVTRQYKDNRRFLEINRTNLRDRFCYKKVE